MNGRSIQFRDCTRLITSLQEVLDRWKWRALSYMGRIFRGRFQYVIQSATLSEHTLAKIRSITCNFVWENQREVSWEGMVVAKEDGGLGVSDYRDLQVAACISRTARL